MLTNIERILIKPGVVERKEHWTLLLQASFHICTGAPSQSRCVGSLNNRRSLSKDHAASKRVLCLKTIHQFTRICLSLPFTFVRFVLKRSWMPLRLYHFPSLSVAAGPNETIPKTAALNEGRDLVLFEYGYLISNDKWTWFVRKRNFIWTEQE